MAAAGAASRSWERVCHPPDRRWHGRSDHRGLRAVAPRGWSDLGARGRAGGDGRALRGTDGARTCPGRVPAP